MEQKSGTQHTLYGGARKQRKQQRKTRKQRKQQRKTQKKQKQSRRQ